MNWCDCTGMHIDENKARLVISSLINLSVSCDVFESHS